VKTARTSPARGPASQAVGSEYPNDGLVPCEAVRLSGRAGCENLINPSLVTGPGHSDLTAMALENQLFRHVDTRRKDTDQIHPIPTTWAKRATVGGLLGHVKIIR